jgi:DNA polymerase-3 subunit delta'
MTEADSAAPDLDPPVPELFSTVVGQPSAVETLRACARRPVHAYLFRGSSAGTRVAARCFAAALLCPEGGCGHCEHCRRALAGTHPDLVMVERTGAALSVDDARRLVSLAQRRPLEVERQVLVVADVHLAIRSAPAFLKTIEEPPSPTVFVLLAEDVPPELVTVASRCVNVLFPPIPRASVVERLVSGGIDPERAEQIADGANGDLHRAQLLAEDESYTDRLELWRSVPLRLDGNGATVAALTDEVLEATEAALVPMRARHAEELAVLAADAEALGERAVSGRREVVDRQHREERRWRTDEIKVGLGVLTRAYRDRLAGALTEDAHAMSASASGKAVELIVEATASMEHNPNEALMLEALLVRLGRVESS